MTEHVEDPYDLQRFRDAQDNDGAYRRAVAELRSGKKQGHWMWFVFPQITGWAGARWRGRFAIRSLDEARAYLSDAVLKERIAECAGILVELGRSNTEEILGSVDTLKLRSSMTLFARAATDNDVYQTVLDQYFDGTAVVERRTACPPGPSRLAWWAVVRWRSWPDTGLATRCLHTP